MERYLLNDVNLKTDIKKILAEKFDMTIFDAQTMTDELLAWRGWEQFDARSTIIVFPGNGASIVKKYINSSRPAWITRWPLKFSPLAKRIWIPGENPQTFVNKITSQMILGAKNIVVVDDVVSSGATARHLRKVNEPWIPGADWHAVVWVKQKSAAVKGYSDIFSVKTIGIKEKKSPINSISTLIECRLIAESYARRNLGKSADAFLKILEDLR